MTSSELSPAKRQAHDLMMRRFEAIGEKWQGAADQQLELLRERQEWEELWRLAGFGDPPAFNPSRRALQREQVA